MNEPTLSDELTGIFERLHIHSYAGYSFGDATVLPVPAYPGVNDPARVLMEAIRTTLYGKCYVRDCGDEVATPAQNMIPVLTQVNQTQDRWDPGWSIYQQSPDGRILVQKGERSRPAVVGEYATNKWPGVPPVQGEQVNLRVYPGTGDAQQGFYYAFGSSLSDQFDDYALLRFYFNVPAHAATELLHGLTGKLNRYAIPFRFKTLVDASAYRRADAAVLYVAKRYHAIVSSLLLDLRESLGDKLRPAVPMFSKRFADGIGMAEEPGTGESFGMHRCRLVAEGIIDAWLVGTQAISARSEAVKKRFSNNGLDLAAPYLNKRSVDLLDTVTLTGGLNL